MKLRDLSNQEIAKILYEMAAMYEMNDVPFKPRAYEKAAMAVEGLDAEVQDLYQAKGFKGFLEIPSVGHGIAEHLEELIKTGKLKRYQQLKKKIPVNLSDLMSIESLGPKRIKILYQILKIKNREDLEAALKDHKIRELSGFGQKSEEKIMAGLGFHRQHAGRFVLGFIESVVEKIVERLKDSRLFKRLEVGGSYRRRQETVGDIDILAMAKEPKRASAFFVKLPEVEAVLAHGETKSEVRLEDGLQLDLRIVPEESWGAALQYFTGDKSHNIKLRKIAIEKGLKLSEYGLTPHFPPSRGGKGRGVSKIETETEEQVYLALGMDWIPPELRTDSGEIEAAQKRQLPKIIEYGDVRGDLQVQTNWTDGSNTIEDMAKAAMKLGREYIAITDHTKSLAMTGGLDEKKLLKQMKLIDKINFEFLSLNPSGHPKNSEGILGATSTSYKGREIKSLDPSSQSGGGKERGKFRILKGAEVNILKDGNLDIADEVLAKLEIVGVAIHSHFRMNKTEMTERIVKALLNPHVDIFFHPTTRIINKRPVIDFDFGEILKVAKKNKVALEINAYPDRLDLHDTLIRQAVTAGVKLVINTDAHHTGHLNLMHFGEAQARRGWATKEDVLNTRPVGELLKFFAK